MGMMTEPGYYNSSFFMPSMRFEGGLGRGYADKEAYIKYINTSAIDNTISSCDEHAAKGAVFYPTVGGNRSSVYNSSTYYEKLTGCEFFQEFLCGGSRGFIDKHYYDLSLYGYIEDDLPPF